MNGVAREHIPLNEKFVQHMDRCLTCRACEAICPNHVAYGDLIDEARELIAAQSEPFIKNRQSNIKNVLEKLFLARPVRLDRLRQLFYFMQKKGLLRWLLKLSLFDKNELLRFAAQIPQVKFPYVTVEKGRPVTRDFWEKVYPAQGEKRGEVGLFLGCIARITDVETLNSSIYVLNRLGYTVHIPSNQVCCGAIQQHSGALQQAAALTQQNKIAFGKLNISTIITTASGCGVQLLESELADRQRYQITDINEFLMTAEGWEPIEIAPLPQKILIHDPCTLRNVLCGATYPYQLISRIPGVQIMPLAGNDQCCGAAGTYFIDQPEIARMLLENKISVLTEGIAKYLLTSNIGCAMYIASGLGEKKINIEVLHPVTLLARQMGFQLE
jgi:glycolate oxidase iron-sulfur subunit